MQQQMGRRLREVREARGWNQVQLAAAAGVSVATVSLIEAGQRTPNAETIVKLAGALGVGPGALFPKDQPSLFNNTGQRREEEEGERRIAEEDFKRVADAAVYHGKKYTLPAMRGHAEPSEEEADVWWKLDPVAWRMYQDLVRRYGSVSEEAEAAKRRLDEVVDLVSPIAHEIMRGLPEGVRRLDRREAFRRMEGREQQQRAPEA